MNTTHRHALLMLSLLLTGTLATAGPPSKTAVGTKLACSNAVGYATATVTLCDTAIPGPCFGGSTYNCPYALECGSESSSGLRADTQVCDPGFIAQAFSYSITVFQPDPGGGCLGSSSKFGTVACPDPSPKLTVR
jgi:hypothetical protein